MTDVTAKCKTCGAEVILKIKFHEHTREAIPFWSCPNGQDGKHPDPIKAVGST